MDFSANPAGGRDVLPQQDGGHTWLGGNSAWSSCSSAPARFICLRRGADTRSPHTMSDCEGNMGWKEREPSVTLGR